MKLNITHTYPPKEVNTKFGVKQKSSIKAKEYGENYLSFWCNPETNKWKVGDEIEVADVTTRDYQGKTYYDIQLPKKEDVQNKTLEQILSMVTRIKLDTAMILEKLPRDLKKEYPQLADEDLTDPSEILF